MTAEPVPAWRRSLDDVLATDWTPEDLEEWLRDLADDSEVSDAAYRDASAEVHSMIYDHLGSVLDEPGLWDEGTELDGVDAAVHQLLEGGEPLNERTLAAVGVSYEQYWQLVGEQERIQDRLWQRGSDAASWTANPRSDDYDRVLDSLIVDDPGQVADDPARAWSDPVDPARGLLDDEQTVVDGRDSVFSALTGLDPAEHDTRELTELVRSDWLADWTPQEMREHYRRDNYPVNRLGTQHRPADNVDTTSRSADDDEAARAEQLNHWNAEDNAADSDAATDEEASDDRG